MRQLGAHTPRDARVENRASIPANVSTVLMVLSLTSVLVACGGGGNATRPAGQPRPSAALTGTPPPDDNRDDTDNSGEHVRITITIGDQQFNATLDESAAARDLVDQLPVTVDMTDHGGVEKTGPLPVPLSLDGQPDGVDPEVGDLGYYAPGDDLVLYYGDQSYYPGIVVLGRLDRDAAEQIADLAGPVTATVEAR